MPLQSKTGTLKSLSADAATGIITLELTNPTPPPATLTQSWEVASGPMWTLACGAKIGDTMTVEYDSSNVTVATKIQRA